MESFSIGRVLSRASGLIARTLPSVGLFVLLVQVVNAGLQFIVQRYLMTGLADAQATGDPAAALAMFGSGWYWATLAASLALSALTFAGALHGLLMSAEQHSVSFADCLNGGIAKLLPMLGLSLLWYLGVGIGWMLLLVPGLILMTMWSVAMPVLVGENLGVFASFGRSRELTKGLRMMIFVTLLLFLIVVYVAIFVIMGTIAGGAAMGMMGAMEGNPWLALFTIPMGWLFGVLVSALLASIYLETVTIKGGGTVGQLNEVFG